MSVEAERMKHLDKIETIVKACGLQYKRENIRSLTVIQIFDESAKEWILFDPVSRGKDMARMLWQLARKYNGYYNHETQFRAEMLDWVLEMVKENEQDNAVS